MDKIITWPIDIYMSICGAIAALFIERTALNFKLVQMGVAILIITIIVLVGAHWRNLIGRRPS
jgi:hypothetical protein